MQAVDEQDVCCRAQADEVFFSSIHLYDGMFYPGTGSGKPDLLSRHDATPSDGKETEAGIVNVPMEPAISKGSDAQRAAIANRARSSFRHGVSTQILPKLDEFKPDLILISAGFDGHAEDMYFHLTEADYQYARARCLLSRLAHAPHATDG